MGCSRRAPAHQHEQDTAGGHQDRRPEQWAVEAASPDSPIGDERVIGVARRGQAIEIGVLGREALSPTGGEGDRDGGKEDLGKPEGGRHWTLGTIGGGAVSGQTGVSRAEFIRMKNQMDELQVQLHSAKAMLQVRGRCSNCVDCVHIFAVRTVHIGSENRNDC
jgi:hypothetical protein